jgi:tRNA uridine 5-carboxymethylaminomethyl modification enzyme
MTYDHIEALTPSDDPLDHKVKEQVEIQIKYEGYIEKSLQQVDRLNP